MNERASRFRCDSMLTALLGKEQVTTWWNSPNRAFENRTPNEQWKVDRRIVENYLYAQCSGDYL